jgi:hypothetical protein
MGLFPQKMCLLFSAYFIRIAERNNFVEDFFSIPARVCKNAGIFYAGTNGTNSCYCRHQKKVFFSVPKCTHAADIPTNILK